MNLNDLSPGILYEEERVIMPFLRLSIKSYTHKSYPELQKIFIFDFQRKKILFLRSPITKDIKII